MITQKDMHNMIVRTLDDNSKFKLIKSCGGSVEGIKNFEQQLSDLWNTISETVVKSVEYMNTEV